MPIESEIRSRVEAFTEELVTLLKTAAVGVVEEALSAGRSVARGGRAGAVSKRISLGSVRAKGQKRDPEALEALTDQLGAFVKKNPGLRIEQIGKELGIATKDLALPVKKLIASKRISTKGQRRATTYFAAGAARGSAGKPGRKPGRKPKAAKSPAKRGRGGKRGAKPSADSAAAPAA